MVLLNSLLQFLFYCLNFSLNNLWQLIPCFNCARICIWSNQPLWNDYLIQLCSESVSRKDRKSPWYMNNSLVFIFWRSFLLNQISANLQFSEWKKKQFNRSVFSFFNTVNVGMVQVLNTITTVLHLVKYKYTAKYGHAIK